MAGEKTNTGTGGFDIDGNVYTFDVGVSEALGGPQGQYDKGDISVDHQQKDITNKTRETLAQYLSDLTHGKKGDTKGVPNRYPIVPNPKSIVSITDEKGYPSQHSQNSNGSNMFEPSLSSALSSNAVVLKDELKKGKSRSPGVDGHEFLKRAESSLGVKKYTSAVLASNRFSSPQVPIDIFDNPDKGYNPSILLGGEYGKRAPESMESVTMNRLALIGPTLSMRASAELGSNSEGFDPSSMTAQAGALLPGAAQLAIKRVETQLLTARDALGSITQNDAPDSNFVNISDISWGTLNNTSDQFTGISAVGMSALSIALVSSLLLVIEGLSVVIGLVNPQSKSASRDAQGRYVLGSYRRSGKNNNSGALGAINAAASLDIASLLGIQPTNYPFSKAIKVGAKAFFGIETNSGVLGSLASTVTRGFSADAGFNAIVARSIIRSSLLILDQIKKIGGNPISAAKQILDLVDVLKTSKVIAACNIFAQLGDAILSIPDQWRDFADPSKISQIDASTIIDSVSRNRIPGSTKLAWASNRSPTKLLLSKNVALSSRLSKNLGSHDVHAGLTSAYGEITGNASDSVSRIPIEEVEEIEEILDAEYVPFYFHDVRTNEIVSFHAFLESLSDSFHAAYESSEGYGRVEPIKVYKSTSRSISIAFYLASTSPEDFDDMWVKINKLTTLVYPQYTAGKKLSSEDKSIVFTQPFSQLIGSSPLVRIRLGDLFKSNYSRFALARLFGLGDNGFTLNNKSMSSGTVSNNLREDLRNKITEAMSKKGMTFKVAPGKYLAYDDSSSISVSVGETKKKNATEFSSISCGDFFEIEIEKEHPDNENSVIATVKILSELSDRMYASVKEEYDNPDKPLQRIVGGKFIFPKTALVPTRKTHELILDELISIEGNDEFVAELQNFMSPDNNALVKSFRETGGKGLAGHITSMTFDWLNGPWEISKDRRAPMFCKISIEFSPIHDISPGIDHMGINRAPIYPVGSLAGRKEKY